MEKTISGSNPFSPSGRVALIAGATGLVGREILRGLLADESVEAVHALGRRRPDIEHPKLRPHIVDFAALQPLPRVHEVYLALGTTIQAAGSRAAFRAIDADAGQAVARAAQVAGACRVGLVSSMGANPHSLNFYCRVKGDLEEALALLGFDGLVIARPSLLLGDREALGQAPRTGEKVAKVVTSLFGPLVPANFRPIAAADVARALLTHVPTAHGRNVLLSGDMQPKAAKKG